MLDHVFGDAIGALRTALELAMLERQAVEERFTTDALLGDTRWETSYSLAGQNHPPRIQADITLSWPTWSQTTYRSWYLTGELSSVPAIEIELVYRAQQLTEPPNVSNVLRALPDASPPIGGTTLSRLGGPTVETIYEADLVNHDYAIEVSYDGALELPARVLEDGNLLDERFNLAGGWISATLVLLNDAVG